MNVAVVLITFPIVFLGELPDKTMFASLILATRGRPAQVWLGGAAAFAVHVSIAVTIGAVVFAVLPHRAVEAVVAALFLAGAIFAWRSSRSGEEEAVEEAPSARSAALTAFLVIFIAEWGDLTQILTADLAARYGAPFSVALGAVVALWVVAAIAVTSGRTLMRFVSVRRLRQATAAVLLLLTAYAASAAV